jgi:hypothetical protein
MQKKKKKESVKIKALESCVKRFENHTYDFWLNKIGDTPLEIQEEVNGKEWSVEVEPIWDDEINGTIRVWFTIWGGPMKMFGKNMCVLIQRKRHV